MLNVTVAASISLLNPGKSSYFEKEMIEKVIFIFDIAFGA